MNPFNLFIQPQMDADTGEHLRPSSTRQNLYSMWSDADHIAAPQLLNRNDQELVGRLIPHNPGAAPGGIGGEDLCVKTAGRH